MANKRILVLVPHPDDEVVGAGAALMRALDAGDECHALYLTNGVPARETLWPWHRPGYGTRVARRWAEAEQVAKRLGLNEAGRLDIPTRHLRFFLAEAEGLIRDCLADIEAEELWVPAWEGAHQDHDCANFLASRIDGCSVLEFAEYNNAGGQTNSQAFPEILGTEQILELSPEEQAAKRDLLGLYRSEQANLAFIESARECFRPLPAHDYARPPHPGVLFHARFRRFGWHPRVDGTDPAEVRAGLAAYSPEKST
ncbi:MAG: PIG-L deacetylase family protein [Rhodospirillales bacterium]